MRKIFDSAWHCLRQLVDSNLLLRVGRRVSVLFPPPPPTPTPDPWIPKGLSLLSTIHVELHISDASKASQTGGCLGLDPCFPSFLLLLSHSAFPFS